MWNLERKIEDYGLKLYQRSFFSLISLLVLFLIVKYFAHNKLKLSSPFALVFGVFQRNKHVWTNQDGESKMADPRWRTIQWEIHL